MLLVGMCASHDQDPGISCMPHACRHLLGLELHMLEQGSLGSRLFGDVVTESGYDVHLQPPEGSTSATRDVLHAIEQVLPTVWRLSIARPHRL